MPHAISPPVTWIVTARFYLTVPFIRTTDYELNLAQRVPPYPCEMVTEIERPVGVIPHRLPGTNKDVYEFSERFGIPFEATRGGAETSYPAYRKKLQTLPPPAKTRPRIEEQ